MEEKQKLLERLHSVNIIKQGDFTLRSGVVSPVYVDLRSLVAYPAILQQLSMAVWNRIKACQPDLLCGVPYTALPIAVSISLAKNVPMIICRKEAKDYGTKKQVEGVFSPGQTCLVIEDVITTGASVIKTISLLQKEGLQVTDIVVCVDREEGGRVFLEEKNYRVHSVFTLSELAA